MWIFGKINIWFIRLYQHSQWIFHLFFRITSIFANATIHCSKKIFGRMFFIRKNTFYKFLILSLGQKFQKNIKALWTLVSGVSGVADYEFDIEFLENTMTDWIKPKFAENVFSNTWMGMLWKLVSGDFWGRWFKIWHRIFGKQMTNRIKSKM